MPSVAFALLLLARCASAAQNLVHDCDEVFNYWEPLHFLLYGYGFQTWEYRCDFLSTLTDASPFHERFEHLCAISRNSLPNRRQT